MWLFKSYEYDWQKVCSPDRKREDICPARSKVKSSNPVVNGPSPRARRRTHGLYDPQIRTASQGPRSSGSR
jgi:hypothetical protein